MVLYYRCHRHSLGQWLTQPFWRGGKPVWQGCYRARLELWQWADRLWHYYISFSTQEGLSRPSMAAWVPPLRGFLLLTSFLGSTFFLLIIYFLFRHSLPEKMRSPGCLPRVWEQCGKGPSKKTAKNAPL